MRFAIFILTAIALLIGTIGWFKEREKSLEPKFKANSCIAYVFGGNEFQGPSLSNKQYIEKVGKTGYLVYTVFRTEDFIRLSDQDKYVLVSCQTGERL